MFCKHCGKQIDDNTKFCPECGKSVVQTEETPKEGRKCPNCGQFVNQYAQICRNCGQDLTSKTLKKQKKKSMGCLGWVIVILLIFGSCSVILGGNSEEVEPTSAPIVSTEETNTEMERSKNSISLEDAVDSAESLLKEQFEDCTISYDETGFTATITVDGISLIGTLASSGNEEMKETWNAVVASAVSMSESMTEYFRACGYDDFTVSLNVVNDQNKDNIIVMTMNGILIYDAVSDGE